MESTSTSVTGGEKQSFIERFKERAEFDRFSIISVGFVLIGIVGGITIGMFARDTPWQIAVIAAVTMLNLSLMLALAPMKYITRSIIAALLIDVLFIVMNLF